jgi:EpsI family protein
MLSRAVILFVCLTGVSALIARAQKTEPIALRVPLERFPERIGDWQGVQQPPLDANVLANLKADDYLTRTFYTPEEESVGLFIGFWQSQRQGDQVHSPLNCLPGDGWEPLSNRTIRVPASAQGGAQGMEIDINRYVVQKGLDRQMVLYWYQSHGRVIASEYWSRFFLITDAMRARRTDAALVRVIAPIRDSAPTDEARAEQIGTRFVRALFPVLADYLPG